MKPIAALAREDVVRLEGVLFDLDDTLLTHGALEEDAYRALFRLRESGLALVAVTGRPAGWAEVFARQWPIEGCVAENGAIAAVRDGSTIRVLDPVDPDERRRRRAELLELASEVTSRIDAVRMTDDTRARVSDIAWNIGEGVRVPEAAVESIVSICRAAGARTTRSSVHLHASFDAADKATGVLAFLHARLGADVSAARARFAYVGDSANDAPCFAAFALSIGVRNLWMSRRKISVLPAFATTLERGAGFAEMAAVVTRLRNR